jgi:hypothetical protein
LINLAISKEIKENILVTWNAFRRLGGEFGAVTDMVAGMVSDIDTKGFVDINTLVASGEVSTCVGVLN